MLRRLASLSLALVLAAGCGGAPPAPALAPLRHAPNRGLATLEPAPVPALPSTLVARVPEGTFGPYLGRGRTGSVIVWAAAEGSARGWYAAPLDARGGLVEAPRRVADAPPDVGLVVVRGSAAGGGYTVVSTRRTALSEWVEVMQLGERGELVAAPRSLAELHAGALWVEVVPLGDRRLVLWAKPKGNLAEIDGATLGARGETLVEPAVLASDVKAWQAVGFGGAAALGTVSGDGRVAVTFTDGRADGPSKPLAVSTGSHAEADFDLTPVGGSLFVGWSDTRDGESRVYRAIVGPDRQVRVPEAALTAPLGEQLFVRSVSRPGAARAWVAWETPAARHGDLRAFELAGIDENGSVTAERARVDFDSDDAAVPEFAAAGDGVAALTLATACARGKPCDDADVMPTYVRFDQRLALEASEPLRLEALAGAPAELGWGLSCADGSCLALAALSDTPAPIFVASLQGRSEAWRPAGRALVAQAPPRVRENRVLARTDALSDLALVKLGSDSLIGYVTEFDPGTPWVKLKTPAPDGRMEPLRARLGLVGVKSDGSPLPEQALSLRAHSLGGVALAAPSPGPDALAAWTGVDAGKPQVFLTLVRADGTRRSQRMLTHNQGEDATDVAAVPVGKGWLVAWVDERDGDPELYTTRVDDRLARIGAEHRVTNAPGPATHVTLAPLGDSVLLAWADARDAATPGVADIYTTRVSARDGTPLGAERPVMLTPAHSFAPQLGRLGTGLVLAWLERGMADQAGSAAVMLERLSAEGEPDGEPQRVPVEAGEPTALAVDCLAEDCHLVVAVRSEGEGALFAGTTNVRGEPVPLKRLVALGSPNAAAVPLALTGDELVYADATEDGLWRVRRALLDWP